MIFFFDRDVGIALPKALRILKLPTHVEYHQEHFPKDSLDDKWMPSVGEWGWTLIGHDGRHHEREMEASAIKQYEMGCFLRGYQVLIDVAVHTPKPFIYRVTETGRLISIPIP